MWILLTLVLTVGLALVLRRNQQTLPPMPPPSIGDPALDRDRQRTVDDLRWLTGDKSAPGATGQHGGALT